MLAVPFFIKIIAIDYVQRIFWKFLDQFITYEETPTTFF